MKKNIFSTLLLLFLSLAFCYGQGTILTNDSLIEMKNAGLSESIIVAKINASPSKFDTSTDAILQLKSHNFSDETIRIIIEKSSQKNQNNDLVFSIEEVDGNLLINDEILIAKGDKIQVYLPAKQGRDFLFIEKQKSLLNVKTLGVVADAVGTGAAAVAIGSNNLGTMVEASNVMRKATAVSWGAEAINKVDELPISKNAKKIAGKKMEVLSWELTGDVCTVKAKLGKKKYQIDLVNAVLLKEIKL